MGYLEILVALDLLVSQVQWGHWVSQEFEVNQDKLVQLDR